MKISYIFFVQRQPVSNYDVPGRWLKEGRNISWTKTRVNNLLVNIDADYEFMRQMSTPKKLTSLGLALMIPSEFMCLNKKEMFLIVTFRSNTRGWWKGVRNFQFKLTVVGKQFNELFGSIFCDYIVHKMKFLPWTRKVFFIRRIYQKSRCCEIKGRSIKDLLFKST